MRSTEGALDGLAGRRGENFASGGLDVEEKDFVEGEGFRLNERFGEDIPEQQVYAVDKLGVCSVFC